MCYPLDRTAAPVLMDLSVGSSNNTIRRLWVMLAQFSEGHRGNRGIHADRKSTSTRFTHGPYDIDLRVRSHNTHRQDADAVGSRHRAANRLRFGHKWSTALGH